MKATTPVDQSLWSRHKALALTLLLALSLLALSPLNARGDVYENPALEYELTQAIERSSQLSEPQKEAWLQYVIPEIRRLQSAGVSQELQRDLLQNALDSAWEAGLLVELGNRLTGRIAQGQDQFLAARELLMSVYFNATPSPLPSPELQRINAVELRESMRNWLGVPYRWAGDTKDGVDYSGFVRAVYAEQGITLPRGSYFLSRSGQEVTPGNYEVGDLLIFKREGRTVHVGIYLGSGYFIHAAKGRGVVVSSLSEPKYLEMLSGVRRVAAVYLPDRKLAESR